MTISMMRKLGGNVGSGNISIGPAPSIAYGTVDVRVNLRDLNVAPHLKST